MKKKHLRKFIALFKNLQEAAEILTGKYDDNQSELDILSSKVSTAYQTNQYILDDPETKFLTRLIDEIDNNLFGFPSSRREYIELLVKDFETTAPFLVFSPEMEWMNIDAESIPADEINYPTLYTSTLNLIVGFEEKLNKSEEELNDVEKYVLTCYELLQYFSRTLNNRCNPFKLNFDAIQTKLDVFILQKTEADLIVPSGYVDKINEEETVQKALPDACLTPDYPNENSNFEKDQDTSEEKQNNSLTLESVFTDKAQYNNIMQILVEQKFCHEGTFIWTDLKKGYKNLIASILKYLHFQYYYNSKTGLSNEQIRQIALNTFHVEIAIDTIKHADPVKLNLNFIPKA